MDEAPVEQPPLAVPSPMSGYAVYSSVAENETKNVLFEIAGTGFVYWLAGVWRPGAVLAFSLFALVTVLEALHLVRTAVLGRRAQDLMKLERSEPDADFIWARRAEYVTFVSFAISCVLLYVLFRRIWPG